MRADADGHGPSWRDHETQALRRCAPAHAPCCLNARRVLECHRVHQNVVDAHCSGERVGCLLLGSPAKNPCRRTAGETPSQPPLGALKIQPLSPGTYGTCPARSVASLRAQGAQERRHRTLLEPRGKYRYLVEKKEKTTSCCKVLRQLPYHSARGKLAPLPGLRYCEDAKTARFPTSPL